MSTLAPIFSKYIRSLIVGEPWGEVFPARPKPPLSPSDGRTAALRILQRYLSELTFFRDDKEGARTIAFKIPTERIHIEYPDDESEQRVLPQVAFISGGPIDYQSTGLGNYVDDATYGKYLKNTVFQVQSYNVEKIFIEAMCKSKQERRALREGIKTALSPTEAMAGLRFRMPDFYNQVVTFSVNTATIFEDENSSKNRRLLRLEVEMSYLDGVLVNVERMRPLMTALVDEPGEVELGIALSTSTYLVDHDGNYLVDQDGNRIIL